MTYLTNDEIFDQLILKKIDKFILALEHNIPSLTELSLDVKTEIYKAYFNQDCEFNFYLWIDIIKLLKEKGEISLAHEVAEFIVTYYSDFNYGILFFTKDTYYLYLSLDDLGAVYEFSSLDEYKKFKMNQTEASIFYEI
ncbi:hypothetical protein A374_06891 [Fictibacillus macauensis ZFHKF-1]|uniref:Uncharacterized protein n=1 Tax=Fictibacillus macauensis ZFHKF-1 TaxID=1196324 RepID=I8J2Q8_9BACL|nr:hypothetical protein [Fictibacillus macauensis]EIT86026.1 hypothetical protein A374_06891 [Fictibacillus macauensis ZFHKF-1]